MPIQTLFTVPKMEQQYIEEENIQDLQSLHDSHGRLIFNQYTEWYVGDNDLFQILVN